VIIRTLRVDDIDAVVEFSVRAWQPVFESFMKVMGPGIFPRIYRDWRAGQAKSVEEACRDATNRTWIAAAPDDTKPDGRPVGFVVVAIHAGPRRGEIYMIAVDPAYQNRGIGLGLVNFAVDRIAELGLPLAEIGTGGDPAHAPARHVYEKAGFTPVPLVRYYKALPGGRREPGADAESAKPKDRLAGSPWRPYLRESVNLAHAPTGMLSVAPSRSVVSRTSTRPASATPASTQSLPLLPL